MRPNVYYSDPAVTLWHGDSIETMRTMPDNSVDSIVTDPPYGLGFMGKAWDALPPGEEWARECLRVLKPGGHLLAFGGSRTWHRLAVAVEDAGFEIRDSIAWLYGSGFPKSLDVSKAIDKRGGNSHLAGEIGAAIKAARIAHGWTMKQADAKFCGGSTLYSWYEGRPAGQQIPTPEVFADMVAAWPELAPLAEQVAAAEREVTGKSAHSADRSATGWLGAMDKPEGDRLITAPATPAATKWQGWGTALKPAFEPVVVGRKPLIGTVAQNVQAHGTGALNIDACRIGTEGGGTVCANRDDSGKCKGHDNAGRSTSGETFHGPDTSGGRWPANVVLDDTTAEILDGQSGDLGKITGGTSGKKAAGILGAFKGSGPVVQYPDSTGGASRFFYVAKAPKRERPVVDGVAHPTVKPLALMRWLIRLVTPEGGTVLDPFEGSGTTLEACLLEGFKHVGIEREADYLPLILSRIDRQAGTLAA